MIVAFIAPMERSHVRLFRRVKNQIVAVKMNVMKSFLLITGIVLSASVFFGQTTFEFTIEGMTCQGCVNTATKTLWQVEGVDSVSVDLETKKAVVIADEMVTETDLKDALDSRTNFEALFSGETLPEPLSENEKEGLDIKTITGGKKMKFKDYLAPGKITIFDFYADWCGPCRVFSPKVERLLLEDDSLALRKVDVVNWKSGIAKQLTQDYKLPALPFTLIFDDQENLLGKVEGNDIEKVKEIIDKK